MHCSSKDSLHLFRFSIKNHATVHFNQNLFIYERSSLIQKLLLSDQINQTAFICQNNKREFSLALGHIYMSTTYLLVYNAFLLTVMWREISYHGHDQNKFPGFSPQGLPLTSHKISENCYCSFQSESFYLWEIFSYPKTSLEWSN